MQIRILKDAHSGVGAGRNDASKPLGLLEATFRLVCGQFSIGRVPKKQKNIKIASERARKANQEKTVLGR
jgi:hypothetical protein